MTDAERIQMLIKVIDRIVEHLDKKEDITRLREKVWFELMLMKDIEIK